MYEYDTVIDCALLCHDYNSPQCYSEEQVSEILTIPPLDDVMILILGPFALLSSLFVMYTFYKYPECRKQPGDIILAISISEFLLLIHWMSMVIHDLIYGEGPLNSGAFCQGECFLSISAGTSEFAYNVVFCIYIVMTIRNALYQTKIPKKIFHLLAAIAIVGVLTFSFATKSTGLSLFGMCSFKQTPSFGFLGFLILFGYLVVSSGTIIYFKRMIPNSEQFRKMRKEFLQYYNVYVICQSIIWTFLAVANLMVELNCQKIQSYHLNFFVTIGNTAKLATPVCLSIIRYKDPNIKKKIRPILQRFFPCIFKPQNDRNESLIESPSISQRESNQTPNNNNKNNETCQGLNKSYSGNTTSEHINEQQQGEEKRIIKISNDKNSSEKENFFEQLQSQLRISQIYTIISGIVCAPNLWGQNGTLDLSDITQKDCQAKYELTITGEKIQHIQCLQLPESQKTNLVEKTKMIMYAPKLFKSLMEIDRKMVNLEQSFNIVDNIHSIRTQFGSGDGGRSGSFFYMSNDLKMMVKSMTKDELDIMLSSLQIYAKHFAENPDSLISKIYGVYSFQKGDKSEHILIMRNIQNCPKEYKLRTYDLKGSTVDRSVLKSAKNAIEKQQMAEKRVLKDHDFQELEKNGKVNIDPKTAQKISDILTKDAVFFRNMGVMDYSLLIFKINWAKYSIQKEITEQDAQQERFNNVELQCIESVYEPGVYYQISIIDYLQVWNVQKIAEKKAKQVKYKEQSVDVSAQPPLPYSERFIENIAQKLFI